MTREIGLVIVGVYNLQLESKLLSGDIILNYEYMALKSKGLPIIIKPMKYEKKVKPSINK